MPSLLTLGKQWIRAGLTNEACPGVALVIPSPKVDRIELIAWTIDTFAQNPDPYEDDFRAMYTSDQRALLGLVQRRVRKYRRQRRQVSEAIFEMKGATLPAPKVLNYATTKTLIRAADRFPADSIELLVVDERSRVGSSRALMSFVDRANPLFTLVLTSHEPPVHWSWRHLGEPLVLRGVAQTPPANKDLQEVMS